MTAHAGTSIPGSTIPTMRGTRRWRPEPRTWWSLALLVVLLALLAFPGHVAAAAHAACTFGEPGGTTCGEALVRLGYP